jgi:hypothetical protein
LFGGVTIDDILGIARGTRVARSRATRMGAIPNWRRRGQSNTPPRRGHHHGRPQALARWTSRNDGESLTPDESPKYVKLATTVTTVAHAERIVEAVCPSIGPRTWYRW